MKREILINANPRETRVAIIEDDQLVELLVDRPEARRMVGDIYLGRVEAVLPGIQAAFVDIGTEKSAFLHASDLVFPEDEADAENDDDDEDDERERTTLIGQWKRIKRKTHFVRAPAVIHRETSLTRGLMRDVFSTKVETVTVDSKQLHNEILEYLKGIAPELIDRIKLYEDETPLFDKANIEQELRDLFKRRCDLPSGGYLIIEPTEALVSVDVNSGRYTGKKDPEKTILRTNIEAAREVARQARLRDLGGIIVCDFIDMETKANRDKVLQELRTHLGRDRARTKAFQVSELGLVEMTRQRVRQSHLQSMTDACPTCHGTGRVFTAETVTRRIERSIRRMGVEGKRDHLVVKLHPDVAMYVLEHEKDLLKKLEKLAGFGLELRDDPLLRPDEFKLVVKSAGRDVTQQYAVA